MKFCKKEKLKIQKGTKFASAGSVKMDLQRKLWRHWCCRYLRYSRITPGKPCEHGLINVKEDSDCDKKDENVLEEMTAANNPATLGDISQCWKLEGQNVGNWLKRSLTICKDTEKMLTP